MEMVIHSQLTKNETFICEILENVGPLGQIEIPRIILKIIFV